VKEGGEKGESEVRERVGEGGIQYGGEAGALSKHEHISQPPRLTWPYIQVARARSYCESLGDSFI